MSANFSQTLTQAAARARPAIDYYSLSRLRNNVLLITALLLVNKLGTFGNLACYAYLFLMALRSPQGAIKALSVSGLLIAASDFYVTRDAPIAPLKYLLLGVAGFTIIRAVRNPFGQDFLRLLLLFGAVAALLSLYNGYFVGVALLKVVSFTYGAFCLLAIVQLQRNIAPEMLAWAFALTIVVVGLSYLALLIGAGYGSYETIWGGRFSGYRGVFSHPQTLGVMACLFAVFVTTLMLFIDFPHRKLAAALLLGLLILVYLSESRTGLLGYVLAVGLVLLLAGRGSPTERRLVRRYQTQFFSLAVAGALALGALEVLSGGVSERATQFLAKGEQVESFSPAVLLAAREQQIDYAWENFKADPWSGIGFGTDLSVGWQQKATLLSASTEKGFLPTALLEEVGIIGTTFFVFFIVSLYRFVLRGRRWLGLAMITGLLVVNLGEMMFFAFGGMAMLCWPLVAMCMTVSNAHLQQLRWRQPR